MSEHYDFHYQPTGSGAISGQQVLQQTEDAINELGDYVNDNVGGAMDVAQQALETAQNAKQDAQTALDTANSFSSAIQSAQQDASTALSIAQTAQTTASNANNTAIQAQQDASSAMATAGQVKQQAFVFRYSSTALVASSTSSNTFLDNTDNLKVGDKVIDSSGVLFSVTAIDSANSTFTIGTALIDLANDSDVVHKSGNETISGNKTFSSINGVEPSSLGMPDLSNGIDISSYIDVSQVSTNQYTPPANGWISISVISSIRDSIQTESSSGFSSGVYACTNPNNTNEYIASIIVPCVKNDTVTIYFKSSPNTSTIKYAKFFPCQGNV